MSLKSFGIKGLINFVYKIHSEHTDFSYQDKCMLRYLIRKNKPAASGYQSLTNT